MPIKQFSKSHQTPSAPPAPAHVHLDPVEEVQLNSMPDDGALQRRIDDLEEQAKLIPLLQIQIQALRDERQLLQSQLESRASSASSSSPHPQPVFQAHRVSPVSLNSLKIAPIVVPKRTLGTNTNSVLHRDVGCSPDGVSKVVHRGLGTDFSLKIEGDGGRLYTERDLKKAIEMAHAKMRKQSVTVGTQFDEAKPEKYVEALNPFPVLLIVQF